MDQSAKRMGFYAHDLSPAHQLKELSELAVNPLLIPGQEIDIAKKYTEELRHCAAIVLGLSSHRTDQEIAVWEFANENNIPVVILDDSFGSSLRPAAQNIAKTARLNFVAHQAGLEPASTFGYVNPQYVGPPSHWKDGFDRIANAGQHASLLRKKLPGTTDAVPFAEGDKLIYVPGGKGRPEEMNHAIEVIGEAARKAFGDQLVFVFDKHPGEKATKPEETARYEKAFADREALLRDANMALLVNNPVLKGPELTGLADVTVFAGAGPTESITGAMANRRTAFWNMRLQNGVYQPIPREEQWLVLSQGGSIPLDRDNVSAIASTLRALTNDTSAQNVLLEGQKKNFPVPTEWDFRQQILDMIAEEISR